ncbi:MAG: hypothetical protein IIA87_02020 [Nanoarchaeota archaeon]|nr:hypothetical protein [Nanoarchaeota archaeon]
MSEKEIVMPKVKTITKLYYSNPKIQKAIFEFSKDREVIPSYMMEAFGKRPDSLQYPSDVMGLVNKGATSFHCSEELWQDPLKISADMSPDELSEIRSSWDLLIDIDSHFLDYSKIATKLIIGSLEKHGIKNYGIKFSGSKGFHIIIPAKAFPEFFNDKETKKMFPEWPRAISEYLMHDMKTEYNKEISKLNINFKALEERTKLSKEDITETICPNCGKSAKKGKIVIFQCPECKAKIERPNPRITKRKLKCTEERCPGYFDIIEEKEYFFCENCKTTSFSKRQNSLRKVIYERPVKFSTDYSVDFKEEISGNKMASLDLVFVSSRHLFRMPYSLHEKTALASAVLKKSQIDSFVPKDANPLKVKVLDFYPKVNPEEARNLLSAALTWKALQLQDEQQETKKKFKYEKITISGVTEDMFPRPIRKLLKGLPEGRKRGLFVLLTFLKSLNFSSEYINKRIREWNNLNDPPLKEGYVKSQIDWHLRQKRKILPPNYKNESFYKDLNLLDKIPEAKNPIVEVMRKLRKNNNQTN